MTIRTINDFRKGDQVYHRSNSSIKMIVCDIIPSLGEVICERLNKDSERIVEKFIPEVLEKIDPNASTIRFGTYINKNRW